MTAILRRLPFREETDEVSCGSERVQIKAYQIIVWISITKREILELPPQTPRMPAILDTGHSHYFSIQERHLTGWARMPTSSLPQRGKISVAGERLPLHGAAVWIHPNQPGQRDHFRDQAAFRLELPQGIAVYPKGREFPRLPLLGLRPLIGNKLHFTLDPERCQINLRTPDWRTMLLRWLW